MLYLECFESWGRNIVYIAQCTDFFFEACLNVLNKIVTLIDNVLIVQYVPSPIFGNPLKIIIFKCTRRISPWKMSSEKV